MPLLSNLQAYFKSFIDVSIRLILPLFMSCFFAVVGIFSTDRAVALNWQNGVAPGAVWQSIGNCRLQLNLYTSGSWRIAEVFLYDATYSAKWSPGGVAVGYPNPGTYDDPNSGVLDEQVLLDQCGIAVENLVSTSPAVGASFAETVYFGFSFDYHNVNYEYAFSGANNTNVINSGDVDDTTPPTVSSVSIASNNPTTTLAVANDVVTLTFTASETICYSSSYVPVGWQRHNGHLSHLRQYKWEYLDGCLYRKCKRYRRLSDLQYRLQ